MDALRSRHTEAVAQAIASALGTPGDLQAVYAGALDSFPGCCTQCSALVPALTRMCSPQWLVSNLMRTLLVPCGNRPCSDCSTQGQPGTASNASKKHDSASMLAVGTMLSLLSLLISTTRTIASCCPVCR
jgi:hypothetical protein